MIIAATLPLHRLISLLLQGAKSIHVDGITRGYCRGPSGLRSNTTKWSNCNERS
jgi:hypothetical protein